MQDTCEIRSGRNGVFDCQRAAVGAWQFDIAYSPRLEAVMVCRWHANHFARKGHWDVEKAFRPFSNIGAK
jgi:hypothetical protein